MCRKTRINQERKSYMKVCGKGGFTLVELSVVLALLAIVMTMIISFSAFMHGFAAENKAEYDFLEDHAALKESLCAWVAENDAPDCAFSVSEDGSLIIKKNGTEKTFIFSNGVLSCGEMQKSGLDSIEGIAFSSNGKLIKCVTWRTGQNGQRSEHSFVFSVRAGIIEEVVINE